MKEHERDPDFEWIRSRWKGLDPPPALARAVLGDYRAHRARGRTRRWAVWIPVPAAAALLVFALLWKGHSPEKFQAVEHPRFIIISQGEHP
jgi:hypothetical protein